MTAMIHRKAPTEHLIYVSLLDEKMLVPINVPKPLFDNFYSGEVVNVTIQSGALGFSRVVNITPAGD